MKVTFVLSIILQLVLSANLVPAQDSRSKPAPESFALLELFTSQGCHSCPPAEALLGKIISEADKSGKNVYALEYHVDYWNKYGWKDPYSSFKYTLRQRNYVSVLPVDQAYTPQLVINGEAAILGSDEKQAMALVEKFLKKPALVGLAITYKGIVNDTMLVNYSSSDTNRNYFLKIALVEKQVSNTVGKGENAGKTLSHHHVVTVFSSFDLNRSAGTVKVPLKKIRPGKNNMIIAFVQQRQTMKILGTTAVTIE